jgi:hypothetical protein
VISACWRSFARSEIAGGKQLLGISAVAAGAAEFLRPGQFYFESPVQGGRAAVAAAGKMRAFGPLILA